MSTKVEVQPHSDRELVICRIIDAPPEKVYMAWTTPKLFPEWFAPKPWTVSRAELDVRAGGSSLVVMRGPDGQEMPCPGVYLEVIPNRKIVFTDAYTRAWEPGGQPFFTGVLTFEPHPGGKTKYTARALHWTKEARDQHEQMGFLEGWAVCADQLETLVKGL